MTAARFYLNFALVHKKFGATLNWLIPVTELTINKHLISHENEYQQKYMNMIAKGYRIFFSSKMVPSSSEICVSCLCCNQRSVCINKTKARQHSGR